MASAVTTRAALLPAVGTRLRVVDLELDPPGPGEVRVRLHASGVCSDDLNAFDGSVEVPCPAVLGHEGAGVVEEVGEGAKMAALSLRERSAADAILDEVEYVELSGRADFNDMFIDQLAFPG